MPIYEYQCSKCGEVFEILQKFSDKPLSRCKSCKGKVERLISNSSFQLKGSGWYLTDYARKKSQSDSSGKADATGAKAESKTEGKAAESKKSDTSTTKKE